MFDRVVVGMCAGGGVGGGRGKRRVGDVGGVGVREAAVGDSFEEDSG